MTEACPNCRAMRERAEQLEEELRQLRAMAFTPDRLPPAAWRLTPRETLIMRLLCQHELVTRPLVRMAIQAIDHDWDGGKVIDVWFCHIRTKVGPFGVEIITRPGFGYALRPDQREAVQAAMDGLGQAVIGPPIARPSDVAVTNRAELIIAYVREHPGSRMVDIAAGIGAARDSAQNTILRLHAQGLLARDKAFRIGSAGSSPYLYHLPETQQVAA